MDPEVNPPAQVGMPAGPDRSRPTSTVEDLEGLELTASRETVATVLAGTAIGAALAAYVLPLLLPDLAASLLGEQPKAYWYLSRASGIAAYLLLWLSVMLGLVLTSRFARLWGAGPAVANIHQFASLLGLVLLAVHVLVLLGDRYTSYRLDQLLMPFTASQHEPFWVGLGQVAAYVALPVTFSFYVRRLIGVRYWRLLHYASFGVFWLSVAHGIGAGTDSATPLMATIYSGTCSSIVFLSFYRLVVAAGQYLRPSFDRAEG